MKKKKKKKGFRVFLSVAVVFFAIVLIKQQTIINRLNNEHKGYLKQKENLNVQNTQLQEKIAKSKAENYGEVLAREKLRVIKEGEIFFIDKNKSK